MEINKVTEIICPLLYRHLKRMGVEESHRVLAQKSASNGAFECYFIELMDIFRIYALTYNAGYAELELWYSCSNKMEAKVLFDKIFNYKFAPKKRRRETINTIKGEFEELKNAHRIADVDDSPELEKLIKNTDDIMQSAVEKPVELPVNAQVDTLKYEEQETRVSSVIYVQKDILENIPPTLKPIRLGTKVKAGEVYLQFDAGKYTYAEYDLNLDNPCIICDLHVELPTASANWYTIGEGLSIDPMSHFDVNDDDHLNALIEKRFFENKEELENKIKKMQKILYS